MRKNCKTLIGVYEMHSGVFRGWKVGGGGGGGGAYSY